MTRDDIIRMAREAGMLIPSFRIGGGLALGTCTVPDFERFAGLVAAAERDACAQIVERNAAACRPHSELHDILSANAAAIRARGDA